MPFATRYSFCALGLLYLPVNSVPAVTAQSTRHSRLPATWCHSLAYAGCQFFLPLPLAFTAYNFPYRYRTPPYKPQPRSTDIRAARHPPCAYAVFRLFATHLPFGRVSDDTYLYGCHY